MYFKRIVVAMRHGVALAVSKKNNKPKNRTIKQ